jgi:hypothetical protein
MKRKKWRARTVRSSLCRRTSSAGRAFCSSFIVFLVFTSALQTAPAASAASDSKLKPTDDYALIFGTVWGPDDHPVYGIKVEIRRAPGKKPHWELYSDHSGEFAQRVPAGEGDYVISADLKGVKTKDGQPVHLKEPVTVHVEYDERVDMSLHLTR